jgi:PAS domain S-box-containing protein
MGDHGIVAYRSDVRGRVLESSWLHDMGAVGYLAFRLKSASGRNLGHLCVVHTGPLAVNTELMSSVQNVARETAAELARIDSREDIAAEPSFRGRITESTLFGVCHRDVITGEVWNNRTFERLFGRSYQQCRTDGWHNVVHPDDFERFAADSECLVTTGELVETTFRVIRPDGELRWLRRHAAAEFDAAGMPTTIMAMVVDLTETHSTKAELSAAVAELEMRVAELDGSLNAFPDMRFRLTADGTYLGAWAGKAAELLRPAGEIIGAHVLDHFPSPLGDTMLAAIRRTVETGEVSTIQYTLGEPGETKHFEARLAPLPNDQVIAVVRDISDVKSLEARLAHAAAMQSIGALAGGVAHDFNNVLHVIRGHASALKRDSSDPETTEQRLDAITRAVDRTSSLIEQLMSMSRPAIDNPTPTNLDRFLERLGPSFRQLIGETVHLVLELGCDGAAIVIDDSRLEGVMLNLIGNASDAMPHGGTLTIRTRCDGATARIDVTDTGVGMNPEVVTQVFKPFFTTKASGVGTGLGLATTYSSIVSAGGSISVESSPGAGSTFVIELPVAPEAGTSPVVRSDQDAGVRPARGVNILVVEDDPDVLELCADILGDLGYGVVRAGGGADALAALESGTRVDAVLTDVVMPGLSGPALAQRILAERADLPVIYMSGYAREAVAANPERLLRKPFSSTQLHAMLDRHLVAPGSVRHAGGVAP